MYLCCIGSGVDVYVFAEGINHDHEEFEGRAFDGGYTRLNARTGQPEDCSSKYVGTHVASLAVGKYVGVATKANVYRYVCATNYVCTCATLATHNIHTVLLYLVLILLIKASRCPSLWT